MNRRSTRWRRLAIKTVLIAASGLAINMASSMVKLPQAWPGTPFALGAAVLLLTGLTVFEELKPSRSEVTGPDSEAATDLGARLLRDWSDEAARREVTRPAPVVVSVLDRPSSSQWAS